MAELSNHINDMVTSLINQQTKLSMILETIHLPLGTYEYNTSTKELNITNHTMKILGIIIEITEDFQEKQLIEHERDVDLLTNLLSRRAFYHHLEELFQNPEKLKSAAFVMIDSDNLKFVNDTCRHASGDRYLQAISGILDNFPGRKLTARLSGDEFILFLYGYDSREEIEEMTELLYQQRQHSFLTLKKCCISVEFSAGCAFYPEDGTEYSRLMKIADKNMYTDKKTQKGVL